MARATKKLLQVVIMEPLPCMREGLKAALERSGDYAVVVDVGDAAALKVALADGGAPDLALVDVSDGASDGFGALGWLQAQWPELRCVAYSLPAHDGAIVRAYRGGARALLSKDMTTALLMRAMKGVRKAPRNIWPRLPVSSLQDAVGSGKAH
jgi:DNA-binding NarL/FixJ family response regulator